MKNISIVSLILVAAVAILLLFQSPYNSNDPETILVAQAFADLKTAWFKNDVDEVIRLCEESFDPYSTENFPHMDFMMSHHGHVKRTSLSQVGGKSSLYRFQPNSYRTWHSLIKTPHFLLGPVYFYTNENDEWKFTGQIDFHVD